MKSGKLRMAKESSRVGKRSHIILLENGFSTALKEFLHIKITSQVMFHVLKKLNLPFLWNL